MVSYLKPVTQLEKLILCYTLSQLRTPQLNPVCLIKFYCLSLYGCSLWNLSCHSLCSIEVSFNNILRCIWNLPRNCHTGILHLTVYSPAFSAWFNPGLPLSSPVHCLVLLMLSRPFFMTPVCWLLLKLGLMPCLVVSLQSPIVINMASVVKLSVIFVCKETIRDQ